MPSPLSRREFYIRLRHLGFEGPYPGGKHEFMKKGKLKLRIPNPHGSDLSGELIARVLRQAGISEEEWDKARDSL